MYTIWGNKVAPWLADRYLAKTAVDSQQMDVAPSPRNREGNLFDSPDEGDPGAHGRFDEQAHPRSMQLWATRHRRLLGAVALTALAGAAALPLSRSWT